MQPGLAISLSGHGALILAAIVGWPFMRDPSPVQPQAVSVSLVSSSDFEEVEPVPPADVQERIAALPPPAPETPRPPAPAAPEAETPTAERPPAPEVQEAAPPPPVDRVAPVPQPVPERDLPEAEVATPAVTPEPSPEATPAEETEAAAPEAAAPQVVTEAVETEDNIARAPAEVPRPAQRRQPEVRQAEVAETTATPEPPRPEPVNEETPEPEPQVSEDTVAAALAEAMAQPQPEAPRAASGPPLTGSEEDGFRVAVGRCWNFAALSTEAAKVTVVVSMSMTADGKPVSSSLRLANYTGGGEDAAGQAYETARRAILRCAGEGYPLPAEKYDQWREIEMTFNPERMRVK